MDETQTGMWEEEREDAFLGNMSDSGDEDTDEPGDSQEAAA